MRDVCETGSRVRTSGGTHESEMHKAHLERLGDRPMRVACALCPDWSFEGMAENALYWQAEHRKMHGPTKKLSRRAVRNLKSFQQTELTDEDVVEIEAEVTKRRRLHGLEAA